jgi:hypothetical protein
MQYYVVNTSLILFMFYECQFIKYSKACFGFLIYSHWHCYIIFVYYLFSFLILNENI